MLGTESEHLAAADPCVSASGDCVLAFQRSRFQDKSIRQCDKISSVWARYNHKVGGSSIRDVHEAHKEAWDHKSNFATDPIYQAWLKWLSIIERIVFYSTVFMAKNPHWDQDEAERYALQFLELQQKHLNMCLRDFRKHVLSKNAMNTLLDKADKLGNAHVGNELMEIFTALQLKPADVCTKTNYLCSSANNGLCKQSHIM